MLSFAVLAGLLTMLPGLDTVQVLRSATVGGRRAAYRTLFGIIAGVFVLGLAAATGISAVILASDQAYQLLKILGGTYLIYLGVSMAIQSRRVANTPKEVASEIYSHFWKTFSKAFIITVTNPKGLAFYIAVMPAFLPEDMNIVIGSLILATIHNFEVLVWFSLLIWSTHRARSFIEKPQVKFTMELISAMAMLFFGFTFIFGR